MRKRLGFRMLIASAAIIVIAGGAFIVRSHIIAKPDFAYGSQGAEVTVDISVGASGSKIARALVAEGVIKSFGAFFDIAVRDSRSTKIAPGSHRLNLHIPAKVALTQLLDPTRIANLIRIPEGAWTDEIVVAMAKVGFTKSELLKAFSGLKRPVGFTGDEGILFPAQYSFGSTTSAVSALQTMVDRFSLEARSSGIQTGTREFSAMQLLTIASIVQAEGDSVDFAKISRVIRNRLALGMPLQLDTTVHYVTRTRGQVFLSIGATRTPSPYNTYLHYGLPPGPIDNPGRGAMDAATHPATGNWLFFITVKPGDTRFTDSNSQFLIWKSEYERNLSSGAFGKKT